MAGMSRYIIGRTIQTVVTLIIILTLIFIMFESLPAKPQDLLALNPNIKPAQKEYLTHLFGFDRPVTERYFVYMKNMLTFSFGDSFSSAQSVWSLLQERIPRTLLLFGLATIISYIIGIYVGAYIAWRRGGVADGSAVVTSLVFYNMPSFWIGLIFLVVFASELKWFPLTGWYDPTDKILGQIPPNYYLDVAWHLTLPLIVLVLLNLAGTVLLMRTAMLDVIGENYMVTAKAIGLPERKVLFRHGTRNAMLPVVTSFIISIVFSVGGAVVLENVFTFPGVGALYIRALNQLDFPVAEATLYIITLFVLIGNFIADLIYGYLDPRVRI